MWAKGDDALSTPNSVPLSFWPGSSCERQQETYNAFQEGDGRSDTPEQLNMHAYVPGEQLPIYMSKPIPSTHQHR